MFRVPISIVVSPYKKRCREASPRSAEAPAADRQSVDIVFMSFLRRSAGRTPSLGNLIAKTAARLPARNLLDFCSLNARHRVVKATRGIAELRRA
jgi:hypothetical protein